MVVLHPLNECVGSSESHWIVTAPPGRDVVLRLCGSVANSDQVLCSELISGKFAIFLSENG